MPERSVPAPGRILVVNVTRIGDTLLATPAVRALARAWPQAEITLLAHPKRVEVVQNLPFVATTGAITKHRARWRGWMGAKRWDLALVYGFDRELVGFALRAAARVVAFRQGAPALDARLYRAVEPPASMTMHAARSPLLLVQALGVPADGHRLSYVVTEEERSWASAFLAQRHSAGDGPLVGLQVAGFHATSYRDWPPGNFAELGRRMLARWPQARFLLFGGEAERSRTSALARELGPRAHDLAGRIALRRSAALMARLDLYVGVDTGPTHIMGALEPPMVALYHCHSPGSLIAPLERARCYVVEHPRAAPCSADVPMSEVTVDAVWRRVLEAMA